jgi:mono/diheme cytochrome c family protein
LRREVFAVVLLAATVSGCRQDMHDAPRYEAFEASTFFADGRASRQAPTGTVARGWLRADEALNTGRTNGELVAEFPFPISAGDMERGRERYNIYCTPCHDGTGTGNGMVVQRGYPQPPSFHIDRLRNVEAGYFFDVMTNGFGRMPDYRAQVSPRDRWNIVAYIRTLQLAQHATAADVPGGDPAKPAVPPPAAPAKH